VQTYDSAPARATGSCRASGGRRRAHSNTAAVIFKPWDKIELHGISTPGVRRIERELHGLIRKVWSYADVVEFTEILMQDRYMEAKSLSLMLLARYHRQFDEALLGRANKWLKCDLCNNWAVTDQLSTQIISRILDGHAALATVVAARHRSPNLWVRRASAVSFVKPAGKARHLDQVYTVVTALLSDSHDLIHKACGWVLREAGKTDAPRLEAYLLEHGATIPRTTLRYSIERFPERKRRLILERTRDKYEVESR
jgi:3-methyladenine DNA glycosylase AlkD